MKIELVIPPLSEAERSHLIKKSSMKEHQEIEELWAERLRPFSGLDFSKKYSFHLKDGSTTTQLGSWLLLEGCDPDEFEYGGYAVVDWDKADNIASFEPVD